MGSRLSPGMSNIYCHILEQDIIERHIKNGNIIYYKRYVDDCILIVKRGSESQILKDMNEFDECLKFTYEDMTENELPYLDTIIYIDNEGTLQLKHYRKPTASNVVGNFRHSISPLKYKISTLCGEIYRIHYSTTTDHDREEALNNMITMYEANGYPRKMIMQKIREIRGKNFSYFSKFQVRIYSKCMAEAAWA
mgnify:CR=1 FL=1